MERTGVDAEDPEDEVSVTFTPWRNHLRAPQSQDSNSFDPPDSAHIFNTIREGRSSDADMSSPANHQPGAELEDALSDEWNVDVKSVYARITKKERQTTPTEHTPEEVQGAESMPPLPERRTAVEG